MKAKINGFEIEGTPEEIKQLLDICKEVKYVPVYLYPTYPNTGTPYPEWPTVTWT